jgi:inosose dehydratase
MPFAVHSIPWGRDTSVEKIAEDAKKAGYTGVELFQHPYRTLYGPQRVADVFQLHGLTLVGMCGGGLVDRIRFVDEYTRVLDANPNDTRIPYVYLDEWREAECVEAMDRGVKLALHPHMFKTVQTLAEAEAYLKNYPRLKFLPDTAHLTIAGDDPFRAISNNSNRLAAIHIKDWRRDVGRSYQFYARGFCCLGEGDIDFTKILAWCHRFSGWLVVEMDFAAEPLESTKQSLDWLLHNMPSRG